MVRVLQKSGVLTYSLQYPEMNLVHVQSDNRTGLDNPPNDRIVTDKISCHTFC